MSSRDFLIKFLGDSKGATKAMGEVEEKAGGMGDKLKSAGKMLAGVGIAGGVAAAGGIALSVKKFAQAGDEVQKMALRTGFSTEALSELRHAAELSDTSLESIAKASLNMQKGLLGADRETAAATRTLDELGVSAAELQGLNPEQQFLKMTEALSGISDEGRRAAMAAEIFGKSGVELLPMLADGADGLEKMRQEARDLGLVMSQEDADAAAAFNDMLTRLKGGITGVMMEVGRRAIPILLKFGEFVQKRVVPVVREFVETLQKRVVPIIKRVSDFFTDTLAPAVAVIVAVLQERLTPAFQSVIEFVSEHWPRISEAFQMVKEAIGVFVEDVQELVARIVDFFRNITSSNDETAGRMMAIWEQLRKTFKSAFDAIVAIGKVAMIVLGAVITVAVKAIQKAWERWGETIMATAKTVFDAILKIIEGVLKVIQGVFEVFAGIFTGDWRRAWDGVKDIFSGILGIITGLWEALWSGIKLAAQIAWDALSGIFKAGWNPIRDWIGGQLDRLVGWFKDLPGRLREGLSTLKDALTWPFRTAFDGIKGIVNAFIRSWNSLQLSVPSVNIPGIGQVGGFSVGVPKIPEFANGGIVPGPVGSPQLILAHGGETVLPTHKRGGGGGGNTYITVTLSGVITDPVGTGQAVADALNAATRANGPVLRSGVIS